MPALVDLAPNQCHFPVTAEAPHRFCGHLRKRGSPYCHHHHHLCTNGVGMSVEDLARWIHANDNTAPRLALHDITTPLDEEIIV